MIINSISQKNSLIKKKNPSRKDEIEKRAEKYETREKKILKNKHINSTTKKEGYVSLKDLTT